MVTNPKYECPHCSHSCSQQYFVKHLINNHLDVFKNKYALEAKTAYNHKKPMTLHTKNEHLFCCLGCSKFWARKVLATAHFEKCPNKKEHLDACKSIFENSIECSANDDNSELVKKLQEEIKKLKRKVDSVEFELEDSKQKVEVFDTLCACIYDKTDEDEREEWRDWLRSHKEDVEWEDYV